MNRLIQNRLLTQINHQNKNSLIYHSITSNSLLKYNQHSILKVANFASLRYDDNKSDLRSRRRLQPTKSTINNRYQNTPPPVTVTNVPNTSNSVINVQDPAHFILAHGSLGVSRQIEMLNVFLGYEQANRYIIHDQYGNNVGLIAENQTFFSTIARQVLRTHRSFSATIMDLNGNVVLKVHRPLWLINSRITISTADDKVIGEVHQIWHLWRRKYELFVGKEQFAMINAPFLSWDFEMVDQHGGLLGFITKNFTGFMREIFTDTSHFGLVMDSLPNSSRSLTLDERAVALATAVTLDIDYFTTSSGHSSLPFFWYFSGSDD